MNNHDTPTGENGDVITHTQWYRINPTLSWMLVCAIGSYAALLLEPESRHWIMEHHLDALKTLAILAIENALPLLWSGATAVTTLAVMEVRRASRSNDRSRAARLVRHARIRFSRSMRLVS